MKEAIGPQIARHLNESIGGIITEVVKEFVRFMEEFMKFQAGNAEEKAGGLEVNQDFEFQIGDLTSQIMAGGAIGGTVTAAAGYTTAVVAFEMSGGAFLTGGLLTVGSAAGAAISSISWTKKTAIDEMAKSLSDEICDVSKYKMIYDS